MGYVLQSTENNSLYFNGSVLEAKNNKLWGLFSPITNARVFNSPEEAIEVSEVIEVPVNLVEV